MCIYIYIYLCYCISIAIVIGIVICICSSSVFSTLSNFCCKYLQIPTSSGFFECTKVG